MKRRTLLWIDSEFPEFGASGGKAYAASYLNALGLWGFDLFVSSWEKPTPGANSSLNWIGTPDCALASFGPNSFEVVFGCRPDVMGPLYSDLVARFRDTPFVYVMVDHHEHRLLAERQVLGHNPQGLVSALRASQWEAELCAHASLVMVASEADMHRVTSGCQADLIFTPMTCSPPPDAVNRELVDANRLLFVGSSGHGPNFDGLRWFLKTVWPRAMATFPDGYLDVVGVGTESWRDAFEEKLVSRVSFHGRVENLAAMYAAAVASIAPLRYGAGANVKVVESLSIGTPVIATSVAADALPLATQIGAILKFSDAEEFTEAWRRIRGDIDGSSMVALSAYASDHGATTVQAVAKAILERVGICL